MRTITGLFLLLAIIVAFDNAQLKAPMIGMPLAKILFNVLNTLLFICGVIILSVGFSSRRINADGVEEHLNKSRREYLTTLATAVAFCGLAIVGIAVVGAVAVNCDFTFRLIRIIYVITLAVIAIILAILGIVMFFALTKATDRMRESILKEVEKYESSTVNSGMEDKVHSIMFPPMDKIQKSFKCCGVSAKDIYANRKLPDSCCSEKSLNNNNGFCVDSEKYEVYCDEAAKTITTAIWWLGLVLLCTSGFLFALIALVICL